MGKKRRLIKKSNKFARKHSSHPMFKKLHSEQIEITVEEKITVEVKKEQPLPTPPTDPVINVKPEPVVKLQPKLKKLQLKRKKHIK